MHHKVKFLLLKFQERCRDYKQIFAEVKRFLCTLQILYKKAFANVATSNKLQIANAAKAGFAAQHSRHGCLPLSSALPDVPPMFHVFHLFRCSGTAEQNMLKIKNGELRKQKLNLEAFSAGHRYLFIYLTAREVKNALGKTKPRRQRPTKRQVGSCLRDDLLPG